MKWEILNHKILYEGFFRLDQYRVEYDRFEGGRYTVIREVLERGDAVAVLPYDPVRDEIVLVEQFRAGALRCDDGPWLLELIAGMLNKGKTAEETIHIEAWEEAGCRLHDMFPVYRYLSSPGGSTENTFLYAARTDTSGLGGIYGLETEHEDIKVHVLSVSEALDLLSAGKINNAVTIIGLQWLALNRVMLRQRWA